MFITIHTPQRAFSNSYTSSKRRDWILISSTIVLKFRKREKYLQSILYIKFFCIINKLFFYIFHRNSKLAIKIFMYIWNLDKK